MVLERVGSADVVPATEVLGDLMMLGTSVTAVVDRHSLVSRRVEPEFIDDFEPTRRVGSLIDEEVEIAVEG